MSLVGLKGWIIMVNFASFRMTKVEILNGTVVAKLGFVLCTDRPLAIGVRSRERDFCK